MVFHGFHGFSWVFMVFMDFHGFSWFFMILWLWKVLLSRIENILDPMSAIPSPDWNLSARYGTNDTFWAVGRPQIVRFQILSIVSNVGKCSKSWKYCVFYDKPWFPWYFQIPHIWQDLSMQTLLISACSKVLICPTSRRKVPMWAPNRAHRV